MQVEQQAESSTAPEDQIADTQVEANQSTDKAGETEDSLLAVVQNVANKEAVESAAQEIAESPPAEKSQQVEGNAEPSLDDDTDYSKLPIWKQKEFRGIVSERNHFRKLAKQNLEDAKQYRDIQSYMQTNGLTADEVAQALDTLAKMKSGDPTKAYELMQERMDKLALMAGKRLPPELEEKVEQGYIDRDTALHLYQQQADAERKAQQAQSQLERLNQQDQQSQVQAIASAVSTWEAATRASDPDFELKAELVKDRVRAHVATHGVPTTADAALKVSKDAYDAVTQTLLKVRGDKAPMRTTVGGKTNGSAAPEPKSLLDVVRRASAGV